MNESDYINWWKKTKEKGLEEVEGTFIKLFKKAKFLPSIYHPVLYRYLKNVQLKHWNKEVFSFSQKKIQEVENVIGENQMQATLLSSFHLLVAAYQNLLDIEEKIILMNRFKGNEEIKVKIFAISIYNDLLNNVFGELLKIFIEFESVKDGKNLFQKTLTPQIELLSSSKRGYEKITNLANSNIRNAVSHGGVKVNGSKIMFSYRQGKQHLQHEITVYEFKDSLLQLFDGTSAVILSWFGYLCEKNITYNEIYENDAVQDDTSFFFEKLCMSTLQTTCDKIYQIDVNNQDEKRQHVNVEFIGVDLDIDSRLFLGICTAERIFNLRKLALEDTIMVSFNSPKIITSFFNIDCSVINELSNGMIDIQEATRVIWNSNNILMFPINDEERNEFEDNFRFYQDIESDDYYITEIEDISNDDKKRFKAVAYLKRAKRPNHVKSAVSEIIDKLKSLENYGFSSHRVKHGKMNADIIYLVLYKKEVRRGKDRSLLPNNDNFIVQIQYDVDMNFPIKNQIINKYLKKRYEKEIEYNWNPNF